MGWGIVAIQPNTYEATTQIYVNADSSMEMLRNRLATDGQYFTVLDMVRQSLLNRRQLEKVVQAAGPLPAIVTGDDGERLIDRLLERIEITGAARWNNLYRISYADSDRRKALAVVKAFVSTVAEDKISDSDIEESSGSSEHGTKTAPDFRIIDPPAVGSAPVAPNRSMWTVLILVASLGAGAGLAFLLNLRNPVFDSLGEKMHACLPW